MTKSHTDWWNQYLESDDPDHVVVQMDKEIELLRDQRDTNLAKEVERIASLTTQRDEYKVWWERDSTSLGKALNEVSSLRAGKEQFRAAIEQLHAAVKTAQELAATRLMEIAKLNALLAEPNYCARCGVNENEPREQPVATPGATDCGEDSVSLSAESSRPRELLSPFDSAAILAAPRERRISMSFETQEQYEAALVFLDMADQDTPPGQRWVERSPEESDRMLAAAFKQGASRDASQGPNAWADAKGGLPDNKL